MTKRILAILMVLVSLMVCCGALAGSKTEANIKDNVSPTIGEVKVDKAAVVLKEVEANQDANASTEPVTETVTITAKVTDDTCEPDLLTVYAQVCGYNTKSEWIFSGNENIVLKYDNATGLYKGTFTFDTGMPSGTYKFSISAFDLYSNSAMKEDAVSVALTNQFGTPEGQPVITAATAKAVAGDNNTIVITVNTVSHLDYGETQQEEGYLFDSFVYVLLDNEGNQISYMKEDHPYIGEGGTHTSDDWVIQSNVKSGTYTVSVSAFLKAGELTSETEAEVASFFETKLTIDATITSKKPVVMDWFFGNEQKTVTYNGKTVNEDDAASMHFKLSLRNLSDSKLYAYFMPTAGNNNAIELLLVKEDELDAYGNTVYSGVFDDGTINLLSKYDRVEGEYKLVCILDPSNEVVRILPDETITFNYVDKTTYTYRIVVENTTIKLKKATKLTDTIRWTAVASEPGKTIDNPGVTFVSADPTVATVDPDTGVVTAVSIGSTTITVKSVDGRAQDVTITVEVAVQPATSVHLNKSGLDLNLSSHTSEALLCKVLPDDTTDPSVVWTTSNPLVATVDQNGVVTAVGIGYASITAMAADGSNKCDICNVTVKNVAISIVMPSSHTMILDVDTAYTVPTRIEPSDAKVSSLIWVSNDPTVATVDANGTVTPVNEGTARIIATSADDPTVSNSINIYVEKQLTESIKLNCNSVRLEYNPKAEVPTTFQLEATVNPVRITTPGIVWTTSNADIATVDAKGLVTLVSEGKAVITAMAADGSGKYDDCEITVTPSVATAISFPHKTITIKKNKTKTLTPNITPASLKCRLSWSSSNPEVASVKKGVVTAHRVGICRITCTIRGTQLQATVRIRVIKK